MPGGGIFKVSLRHLRAKLMRPLTKLKLTDPIDGARRKLRRRGSSLAEFGPALFFLFLFAVFPVLDIIGLSFGYLSSVSLNDLQLRQAAKVPKSQAQDPNGSVCLAIPETYVKTVAGGLASISQLPVTEVSYDVDPSSVYVVVTTHVTVRPFLTIPFFPMVPGIGAPATYTITSSRLLENPRYAVY